MWTTTPTPSSPSRDRKSTRLNSSHANNSYAVFCLKKKNAVAVVISPSFQTIPKRVDDRSRRQRCPPLFHLTRGVRSSVSAKLSAFFFNDTATTEIYTLSLHDALPISADMRSCSDLTGSSPSINRSR